MCRIRRLPFKLHNLFLLNSPKCVCFESYQFHLIYCFCCWYCQIYIRSSCLYSYTNIYSLIYTYCYITLVYSGLQWENWIFLGILMLLVHLDQRSRWTIAITWRPSSVNFSHFKLLLRNHWANWNQTLQECSLDGPLQSYCFSFQSDIQHGCQGQ